MGFSSAVVVSAAPDGCCATPQDLRERCLGKRGGNNMKAGSKKHDNRRPKRELPRTKLSGAAHNDQRCLETDTLGRVKVSFGLIILF